ncbi:lipopolysaccharide biosynthesis protein [Afifella sp. IM 167]|uniref:lipopolysaccharide biosynthesis protein n=1 Tax=Afifella sp. IM 167 TaxID=2033586 RepID=UPI001CCB272B|nr:lipopolysaccharide biosynthesis protein [Afifella sp. IM 167]
MFSGAGAESVLKILVIAVLARILTPAEFGIVSAAMAIVALAEIFGQIGVPPAIVQIRELTERHIRVGFTVAILSGLLVGGAVYYLAPVAATMFQIPEVEPVVAVLALAFPIKAVAVVSEALLRREMRFRVLATLTLLSYLVGYSLVSVVLALLGFGVWSLVAGVLAQFALMSAGTLYYSPHAMRPLYDWPALKTFGRFGFGITLSRLGNYIGSNIDYVIVGRFLGVEALGLYSRAYQMLLQPTNLIGKAGENVLFPALASIQTDMERTVRAYYRALALIVAIALPLSAYLVVVAPQVIHLMLGSQWDGVILPFRILVLFLCFRMGYKVTVAILRAQGAVYRLAFWQWLYAISITAGAMIGQLFGIAGVAAGVSLAIMASFIIGLLATRKIVALSLSRVALMLARHGLVAIVVGAAAYGGLAAIADYSLPSIIEIGVSGVAAGIALLALWFIVPSLFGDEGKWIRSIITPAIRRRLPTWFPLIPRPAADES